jgi:hypothetical protein
VINPIFFGILKYLEYMSNFGPHKQIDAHISNFFYWMDNLLIIIFQSFNKCKKMSDNANLQPPHHVVTQYTRITNLDYLNGVCQMLQPWFV